MQKWRGWTYFSVLHLFLGYFCNGCGEGGAMWSQIWVVLSLVPIAEIVLAHFLLGHNIWLVNIYHFLLGGQHLIGQYLSFSSGGQHLIGQHLSDDDGTMPIINKPRHPKRGNTRNKMKGPHSRRQKNHLWGQTTREISSFQTPSCCQEAHQIMKGGGLKP